MLKRSKIYPFLAILSMALLGNACGNAGSSTTSSEKKAGVDIIGSITNQSGAQSDMAGWVVMLIEKDTEISRVAQVTGAGLFTLKHVDTTKAQTLALASPTYVVRSVLSQPSTKQNTIRQYFTIDASTLPRLVLKGEIVTFQTEEGITILKDLSSDQDADGIPDGSQSLKLWGGNGGLFLNEQPSFESNIDLSLLAEPKSTADIDVDGIKNIDDPDIDGDGIPNIIDADDDGDAIFDIFDADSDGDVVEDAAQTTNDAYFKDGVEWISVKFDMSPKDDGTYKSTLTFTTKLREDGDTPLTVQILGAPAILNGANIEHLDEEGKVTEQKWDRLLQDDGKSEDSGPGDLLFARKVTLEAGKVPAFHQIIYFQLTYGKDDNAWAKSFAYTFPPFEPKKITPSYDKFTGTVSLAGNPFGDIQDFVWSVSIYDKDETMVYSSPAILGTARTYILPTNAVVSGETYTYKVTAQVLDKIPGYSSFSIESATATLTTN